MNYKNINKIFNKNKHNKIKTYLEFIPIKQNQKNKPKKELSIKEKDNFHTINIDYLPKSKINSPFYQKISLLETYNSDSKIKKENINKKRLYKSKIKSAKYRITLKIQIKDNKINK